ncbi:hypothetical protein [Natronolimnobius baerhuensis]|uniref:Uncharacterized protein n=1 Tax=Natronolimnobius baerhuensis TaxID=253108 RepID=A0A202EBS8_9EURY|nr:hypothetical protein [Natronolimnobius baerhuensis]OVE85667.1 hypothetical protein B2G88_02260 [Natronolimnobius baerhuensis]
MKDKEGKNHPHLLMLDEFDGEIDGELKYQKVLYKYRVNALEDDDWSFTRERWGPTDPGFTEIMQSLDDLDLAELEEDDRMHIFRLTDTGEEVADGLKRGLSKLDPGFSPRIQTILGIAESDKDRSGSEIVEDEIVQNAKEETEQSQV